MRMPVIETVAGALGWGAAMALSAQAFLWLSVAALTSHYWSITALVFCGAALAWPLGMAAFRFIAFRRHRQAAFAAAFLCLSVFTIGITALIYALIYRNYYAQWHGETFSKLWLVQLVFTMASALYQFAVQGVRLYLPLGVAALFAASAVLAREHDRENQSKTCIRG